MGYLGNKPTAVPIESSDLADNLVTSAKIANGAITGDDINSTFNIGSKTVTLPSASVTAHVTATDLQPIKSDLTALAIREATNEASAAFNLPSSFIETFTDDTNLGTQTDGDRTSGYWATVYSAVGSFAWVTGDQSSVYTMTSDLSPSIAGGTAITDWIDGVVTTGSGNAWYWSSTTAIADDWIKFDLGVGNQKAFQGARMYTDNTNAGGVWKWQGSNNDVAWTDLSGNFSWNGCGATTCTETWSSSTGYRYIRILGISGNSDTSTWQKEVEFNNASFSTAASATGTLIQSANAVTGTRTTVGGTMLYKDNAGTASLGTDLKIYFSGNGGSNWTEAAGYTAITPVYSTGIKQVRLTETTVTGGTDVRYKAVWANQAASSKETQLHAIGINY